jgi:antitoxin MazE
MTTTIVKWGNSRGIRLPKPFLENLGLTDNDTVDIVSDRETIIIRKSERNQRKTLGQRLEAFHGQDLEAILTEAEARRDEPVEINWGRPVGEEVW